MTEPATPVLAVTRERLEVLDAVRGAAILGILLVNVESLSGYGFVSPSARAALTLSEWNGFGAFFLAVFVEAKFYALFSLLFGVGFAVFVERAAARGADAVRLFKRRLVGLLLIGLVHTVLIWYGDILVTYALLGFGLIPFLRKDDRVLLRSAAFLLVLPAVLYALGAIVVLAFNPPVPSRQDGGLPPILQEAAGHFAHGSYPEIVIGNVVFTAANALRRLGLMFFPRVFAMFLIGLHLGRSGAVADLGRHRPMLRRITAAGLLMGTPFAIAGAVAPERLPLSAALLVEGIAKSIAIPVLTLAYAAGLALMFMRWQSLMRAFAAPGRMALSNYLLHSVAGVIAFYGIGFGLYGRLSLVPALALAVAVFAVQIVTSSAWLSIAAFGPAEWLWRCFTYARRFPLFASARP
jgi:uncharacterized protein